MCIWRKSSSKTCSRAGGSMIKAGVADIHRNFLQQGVLLLILSIPSLYIFLTVPPLWRDTDAFNEVASTFADLCCGRPVCDWNLGARAADDVLAVPRAFSFHIW